MVVHSVSPLKGPTVSQTLHPAGPGYQGQWRVCTLETISTRVSGGHGWMEFMHERGSWVNGVHGWWEFMGYRSSWVMGVRGWWEFMDVGSSWMMGVFGIQPYYKVIVSLFLDQRTVPQWWARQSKKCRTCGPDFGGHVVSIFKTKMDKHDSVHLLYNLGDATLSAGCGRTAQRLQDLHGSRHSRMSRKSRRLHLITHVMWSWMQRLTYWVKLPGPRALAGPHHVEYHTTSLGLWMSLSSLHRIRLDMIKPVLKPV